MIEQELKPHFWKASPFGGRPERARILFGQMRDDVEVERRLVRELGGVQRALVITSGGCGAMSLTDVVGQEILSADINPAQNWLAELKLAAWARGDFAEFERLLCGENVGLYSELREGLSEEARSFWDEEPPRGDLQNCGRVDRFMGMLRRLLFATVHRRGFVERFLMLSDLEEQRRVFEREWNSWRWRTSLDLAFHPIFLRIFFNRQAAGILPDNFAGIIGNRIRHWLTTHPAATNRCLWQSFLGRYPETEEAKPLYLQQGHFETERKNLPKITLVTGDVREILLRVEKRSLDFVSLSNVLELTSGAQAAAMMNAVSVALAPGGLVLRRSMLPQRLPYDSDQWVAEPELLERARGWDRGGLSLGSLILRRRR
ncbi:hypothetical protein BH09VER1_BH09VER1_01380 [soil metagenome]